MADIPSPRTLLDDVLQVAGFFTRLPVPAPAGGERRFADALWAAPLAGVPVALAGWLAFALAAAVGLPATICAALALAATMAVTGCLHEDGLGDVADGFGGGKSRDDKLAIMKDSRIGTYGVAALAISILLRSSALAALTAPGAVLAGLIGAHVASRALLPAFLHALPAARPDGLGAGVGAIAREMVLVAAGIGVLALLFTLGVGGALVAAFVLVVLFCLLGILAMRQIGGQTGDVAGALQQAAEVAVLCIASILLT